MKDFKAETCERSLKWLGELKRLMSGDWISERSNEPIFRRQFKRLEQQNVCPLTRGRLSLSVGNHDSRQFLSLLLGHLEGAQSSLHVLQGSLVSLIPQQLHRPSLVRRVAHHLHHNVFHQLSFRRMLPFRWLLRKLRQPLTSVSFMTSASFDSHTSRSEGTQQPINKHTSIWPLNINSQMLQNAAGYPLSTVVFLAKLKHCKMRIQDGLFRAPQFEGSVERARQKSWRCSADVKTGNFAFVSLQSNQWRPIRVTPNLDGAVKRTTGNIMTSVGFELDFGDYTGMSWYSICTLSRPQVPNFDTVVFGASDQFVSIRGEVNTIDGSLMTVHDHYTSASSEIPHTPETVQTDAGTNWAVTLECYVIHSPGVPLLEKQLLLLVQIPQAPRWIIATSGKESAGRVKSKLGYSAAVPSESGRGSFTDQGPQIDDSGVVAGSHASVSSIWHRDSGVRMELDARHVDIMASEHSRFFACFGVPKFTKASPRGCSYHLNTTHSVIPLCQRWVLGAGWWPLFFTKTRDPKNFRN